MVKYLKFLLLILIGLNLSISAQESAKKEVKKAEPMKEAEKAKTIAKKALTDCKDFKTTNTNLDLGCKAFNKKEYTEALKYFNEVANNKKSEPKDIAHAKELIKQIKAEQKVQPVPAPSLAQQSCKVDSDCTLPHPSCNTGGCMVASCNQGQCSYTSVPTATAQPQPAPTPAPTPAQPTQNSDGCNTSGQSCTCSNTGWSGTCNTGNDKPGLYCQCNQSCLLDSDCPVLPNCPTCPINFCISGQCTPTNISQGCNTAGQSCTCSDAPGWAGSCVTNNVNVLYCLCNPPTPGAGSGSPPCQTNKDCYWMIPPQPASVSVGGDLAPCLYQGATTYSVVSQALPTCTNGLCNMPAPTSTSYPCPPAGELKSMFPNPVQMPQQTNTQNTQPATATSAQVPATTS